MEVASPASPSIFISYRWGDTSDARLLWITLADRLGQAEIFLDRERLHSGDDFPRELEVAIRNSEVFIAVLGNAWVSERQRLHDEMDYVRRELQLALNLRESGQLRVIPIWMGRGPMPPLNSLPPSLETLNTLLADAPDLGRHFSTDITGLGNLVEAHCNSLLARRSRDWLHAALRSPDLAHLRYGQDIAVLAAQDAFIPREKSNQALRDWWQSWPRLRRPFVLTGEEGDGKSWAVASWLAELSSATGLSLPILYLPAIRAPSARLEDLLATAFTGFNPSLDISAWTRNQPIAAESSPAALLVIDALNERSSLDWRPLFVRAGIEPIQIALLLVCRTAYWKKLAQQISLPVNTVDLGPYQEHELDNALARHGMSRSTYRAEVLTLLAKPRYFDLARRFHNKIEDGGVTAERLIYESWRAMQERKTGDGRLLGHEEFCGVIREIAEKQRVRAGEFAACLPPGPWQDGEKQGELLEELSSARILIYQNGKLALSKDHVALGLGLLLADAVEEAQGLPADALDALIAKHTAGQPAMDLEVRIRGMALYHAMRRDDYPDAGRLALLRAWVASRNITPEDLRHAATYLPLHPATYVEMAAELWSRADNREVEDAFMVGLLKYRHVPQVQEALVPAFTHWLGLFHPNGHAGMYTEQAEAHEKGR